MSKCQIKKLKDVEDPRRLELSATPTLKYFIPYNKGSSEMKLQPRNDLALVVFYMYRCLPYFM
jgi:hypothetical protein